MHAFNVGRLTFTCSVEKQDDITWQAKVINVVRAPEKDELKRDFFALGNTEKDAIEKLKEQLEQEFVFSTNDLSVKDVVISLFRWFLAGGKPLRIFYRGCILLAALVTLSLFFIDFSDGSSNTVTKNISLIFRSKKADLPDTGFLNEPFIKSALKKAQNRFWASGVSFRNLRTGNRAELISLLDRNVEMKLILLDPDSPLAQENMIGQISKTARREDILATIDALCRTANGILTTHGNSQHQLLVSGLAPIIPMVVVDDTVYASFLVHTDLQQRTNIYDGPYLKFHSESKFGKILVQNFNNLMVDSTTIRVYPK